MISHARNSWTEDQQIWHYAVTEGVLKAMILSKMLVLLCRPL